MALFLMSRRILKFKKTLISKRLNCSYIVLLPEIGDDTSATDPLTKNGGLPEFSNYTIETCTGSIAKQTLEFESGVKKIEKDIAQGNVDIVKNVLEPLEMLSAPLELTWGISKTLYLGNNTLIPTKTYLPIHERARRSRSTKYTNPKIYEAIKKELTSGKEWDSELKRVMKKYTLEGKLNGLDLENVQIFSTVLKKINTEKLQFKHKIDLQTQNFSHTIQDYNIVKDFPKELLETISKDPRNIENGPWKITLQPHIYVPTMQYCPDREIRWNLWQALVNRGSGYLERDKNTGLHIENIRNKRLEMAKLLGYKTFADMSMETKMAGSVDNVKKTLNVLLEKAKPSQENELIDLHKFAVCNGFNYDRLELWDIQYWRKKQELFGYNYDPNEYKNYFQYTKVLQGLFELCEKLFDIIIKQRNDASTWHKDVKFYDIYESHSSAPVAGFYIDPYSSEENINRHKNINGLMVGIQNKSRICDRIPLASLIFNFNLPSNNSPCYLSVGDVNNLFFRFGHALQHLLTRTSYSEVSGLSNIEWDMVEVCGHVLSLFLCDKNVLQNLSCNENGEKLSDELIDRLFKVKKHMAGLDLCKELYLSALDLELYSNEDYWLKIVKNLWPQFMKFPLDKLDSHLCSFSQIITEEWSSAYYSHFWSKMIAADIYSSFDEMKDNEVQYKNIGKRYRDTFLALGGSVHSSEIFRQFRGRDSSPQGLLNYLGLNDKL